MMSELLVVSDIDDVLLHSSRAFMGIFHRNGWLSPDYMGGYTENWGQIMGVDPEVVKERSDAIWQSNEGLTFQAVLRAKWQLAQIANEGLCGRPTSLKALTSRPRMAEDITHQSLSKKFPNIFYEIIFAGFYDGPPLAHHYAATKEAIYKKLSPDVIIDDDPKHIRGAVSADVPIIVHMDVHNRHKHEKFPDNVLRMRGWQGFVERVEARMQQLRLAAQE